MATSKEFFRLHNPIVCLHPWVDELIGLANTPIFLSSYKVEEILDRKNRLETLADLEGEAWTALVTEFRVAGQRMGFSELSLLEVMRIVKEEFTVTPERELVDDSEIEEVMQKLNRQQPGLLDRIQGQIDKEKEAKREELIWLKTN